jgi:NAD(P)-dependent dehydrogenase (short-subunit alcohol dehydrogenase family)
MAARLKDKIALVTGAGAGIGAATAHALASAGADVAVVDRDLDAARSVADAIVRTGRRAAALRTDVRHAPDARDAVAACRDQLGGLDVLVSNAGVVRYGEVPDLSLEDWSLQLDTNLTGPFLMAHYAIPIIRERGGGAIVNLSSAQALASQPLVAAYAASKAGVIALTKTMAIDHGKDNIRVNCVLPGSVRTPMLREGLERFAPDDPDGEMAAWGRAHPIGRVLEPAEVANLIVFLAGDEASAITGGAFTADGGLSARLAI